MLSSDAKGKLPGSDFELYKKNAEELLKKTEKLHAADILDALLVSESDLKNECVGRNPTPECYRQFRKLGVSPEDFGLAEKIFALLERGALPPRMFSEQMAGLLVHAGTRDGLAGEVYKTVYTYLIVVRVLQGSKSYRVAIDSVNQKIAIPRNVKKKWPNIVLVNYLDTLNDLKAFLGSDVVKFSSKELGGQGEGVFSVRKHKAKLRSGVVEEVVEKALELSSEPSKVELSFFESLHKQDDPLKKLPLPRVYLIKKREALAHVYMDHLASDEKGKRSAEFYEDFAKAVARFNFSLDFHLPSRTLPADKKLHEVLGKLHAMNVIGAAQAEAISEKVSEILSRNTASFLHMRPSHGDVHMRNTVCADQVYFIDYGGFVMAPAGHDLNFLLWLYPSRVAELTRETFLASQARLLDCYLEEAKCCWVGAFDEMLARKYVLVTSCCSWVSRTLKRDFVRRAIVKTGATPATLPSEAEWIAATEKAIDFLKAEVAQ